MPKNITTSELNNLDCIDALDDNLAKLHGILGAIEASQDLDPRLLKTCMWSASVLISEAQEISEQLCKFVRRQA